MIVWTILPSNLLVGHQLSQIRFHVVVASLDTLESELDLKVKLQESETLRMTTVKEMF